MDGFFKSKKWVNFFSDIKLIVLRFISKKGMFRFSGGTERILKCGFLVSEC